MLLTGPSGVGKELAAQAYHAATGRPQGPLVAINCATISRDLAESLLFGARRGAYSGAVADSDGLIVSARWNPVPRRDWRAGSVEPGQAAARP